MKKLLAVLLTFVFVLSVFPTASFAGESVTIKSVEVDDLYLTEYVDGRTNYLDDYVEYEIFPDHVKITMTDGTVYEGDYWDVYYSCPWILRVEPKVEQSRENPWTS